VKRTARGRREVSAPIVWSVNAMRYNGEERRDGWIRERSFWWCYSLQEYDCESATV